MKLGVGLILQQSYKLLNHFNFELDDWIRKIITL
jgi:hypothetical protein